MALRFMKKAAQMTPSQTLRQHLHGHLSRKVPARPMLRVHASELTKSEGFCPRVYALHDVAKIKPPDQWVTTSEEVTWEIGRVLQDSVVNWFADMGKAICHWQCSACNQLHEFQSRPLQCTGCGAKRGFVPKEVRFESAVSGASCGVDMLVALGDTKLTPVEIKTIRPEDFKTLLAPLAEHRQRTRLYLRIIEESSHSWSNLVSHKTARALYITKGGYGVAAQDLTDAIKDKFSPFKEFVIERDDSDTDEPTRRAKVVKDFREGKVGMPCGICSTALIPRAKSCFAMAACFSGDYPPTYDWKK